MIWDLRRRATKSMAMSIFSFILMLAFVAAGVVWAGNLRLPALGYNVVYDRQAVAEFGRQKEELVERMTLKADEMQSLASAVSTAEFLLTNSGVTDRLSDLSILPDGKTMAAVDNDGVIILSVDPAFSQRAQVVSEGMRGEMAAVTLADRLEANSSALSA